MSSSRSSSLSRLHSCTQSMLRSHVRLQQGVTISQCRIHVFSANTHAETNGRKRSSTKAEKNVITSHSPVYEQRTIEDDKKHGSAVARRRVVSAVSSVSKMSLRISRTAFWLTRPNLCYTRLLMNNPPWTSLRSFSQSSRLQERKKADHYDLRSFLEHARSSGLDPTSTYYKGKRFEYQAIETLKSYGMELNSLGRSGDRGKDLEGLWKFHKHTKKHPNEKWIIGQCKAWKVGPMQVRELKGTSSGGRDCIRFLVSTHESSKGVNNEIQASTDPMGFIQITADGEVLQWFWNDAATQSGLGRLGTTMRYRGSNASKEGMRSNGESKSAGTIALTVDGKMWRPRVRKIAKTARARRNVTMPKHVKRKPTTSDDQTLEN